LEVAVENRSNKNSQRRLVAVTTPAVLHRYGNCIGDVTMSATDRKPEAPRIGKDFLTILGDVRNTLWNIRSQVRGERKRMTSFRNAGMGNRLAAGQVELACRDAEDALEVAWRVCYDILVEDEDEDDSEDEDEDDLDDDNDDADDEDDDDDAAG
jgi:hypothetical protein